MRRLRLGLAFLLTLGFAGSASAVPIGDFVFGLEVDGNVVQTGLGGLPVVETWDPVTYDYGYELTAPVLGPGFTINSWSSTYELDPFVTNNVSITNNSGIAQIYILTVAIPIPAFNYDKIVFSSVGFTVTNDGDVPMSVTSPAFYTGTINGVGSLTLLDPVSIDETNCAPFPSTPGCTATTSDGVLLQAAGPGVATQIGIKLEFTLSPGESIGVTSRFEIIPEPTTLLLVGGGLVAIALAGRRRA